MQNTEPVPKLGARERRGEQRNVKESNVYPAESACVCEQDRELARNDSESKGTIRGAREELRRYDLTVP